MKKIFKKNQIIITALAIMIMVAGYLNYMGGADYDGAKETSSNGDTLAEISDISEEDIEAQEIAISDEQILDEMLGQNTEDATPSAANAETTTETTTETTGTNKDLSEAGNEVVGEATLVNGVGKIDILSQAKLNREQTRSKNKELLMEIINNTNLGDNQKNEAVKEVIALTEYAEKEQAAETMLSAKGFTDVVVSMNENGVDVVVGEANLEDAKRAQIEDIVKRKTGVEVKNIVITPIAQ